MTTTPQPNSESELVSYFRFDQILLATSLLPERVSGCIRQSMDIFEGHTASSAIGELARLMNLSSTQQEMLLSSIVSIGHIAFLLPAEVCEAMLTGIIGETGLTISASMPSKIFARELGMLTGRQLVETLIYRMEGGSKRGMPICIEVFVPREEPALVNEWIMNGVGTHIAFLVNSPDAVLAIQDMLEDSGNIMPPFMCGQSMEGHEHGSLTIYYDLPVQAQGRKFRVEFYYEERARS